MWREFYHNGKISLFVRVQSWWMQRWVTHAAAHTHCSPDHFFIFWSNIQDFFLDQICYSKQHECSFSISDKFAQPACSVEQWIHVAKKLVMQARHMLEGMKKNWQDTACQGMPHISSTLKLLGNFSICSSFSSTDTQKGMHLLSRIIMRCSPLLISPLFW